MPLDDLVLGVQNALDRLVRRVRLGRAPAADRRRLLVVQIDGLSRAVLEEALALGRAPFLRRLLEQRGFRLVPLCVGLPSSTPAFQLAAMYGVRPDIPGFHYRDKRRGADVYFPRGGDAALVERAQADGRRGILADGSAYGCVFTGGAANNLLTFAMMWRPSGAGLLRLVSKLVVLGWVAVKASTLTALELTRALLRLVADPVGESARGWRWLAIKIAISVWLRQLFTLAVSRDLYAGVPAIYVNYLDYDVFAHAYGPRHRRAFRALRRVDASIRQLWNVLRRVPEHRYDLWILADHGQAACTPYRRLARGRPLEDALFDEFFDAPAPRPAPRPARPGRRWAAALRAVGTRAPGMFQRFVNYLERDFPAVLGGMRGVREHAGVRVIAAGPNAFVYFVDTPEPVPLEHMEPRFPGLVEALSRHRGVGIVLVRGAAGPLCFWRGKPYRLDELGRGPFAGRDDLPRVVEGVRDLMAMPSAGDLVIYGIDAPEGHVSYVNEVGAHAGPAHEELHAFLLRPPGAEAPAAIAHPIELYALFMRYQDRAA
ncbi:MAG: hypothetical protein A3E31_11895 [Candidatus Rokubacteria bacterium RIFCSPHIGHO2_12_FULL_73_22]|nr:MAG: hypothetical protein A3D33_12435 [Candidatus Rokubacteria bacterium RIFCSPHIGHO2_02_FULL_73_26]OGL04732.1 MAG: hypothetical protein A3E31_11895 [Candidatus Rokubacteria bacterium RIFCSPHIGHO2_12_FULL_73_22]OGL10293.1 MAG: hypothetical protein A3I14_00965 [Candidatus Rokubacteria bacterium RIFCSPLOWO2_02_FULL_73_56]OGL26672.1 MAG: hypothetical protein A3G44_00165 [Candidatus Rokubacteria bacterium RIFCSPLOWO2_12_FULL_73_47]